VQICQEKDVLKRKKITRTTRHSFQQVITSGGTTGRTYHQRPHTYFPRRSVPPPTGTAICWTGSTPTGKKLITPPLGRLITTRGDPPRRPPWRDGLWPICINSYLLRPTHCCVVSVCRRPRSWYGVSING